MTNDDLFDTIAREHAAMIKRIAMSHEARSHLAEELVQEIYLAIWRALPSFRLDSSLRTFVARIATNRSVSHVMRAVKLPLSVELDDQIPATDGDPEHEAIIFDDQVTLVAAVQALPWSYRQVVVLALEGLAPLEIAGVLGISANAVAIRLTRAKGLMRKLLGDKS